MRGIPPKTPYSLPLSSHEHDQRVACGGNALPLMNELICVRVFLFSCFVWANYYLNHVTCLVLWNPGRRGYASMHPVYAFTRTRSWDPWPTNLACLFEFLGRKKHQKCQVWLRDEGKVACRQHFFRISFTRILLACEICERPGIAWKAMLPFQKLAGAHWATLIATSTHVAK